MNEFLMHRETVCKLFGIVCILIAGAGCGAYYSRRLRRQLEQLRQLQQLVQLLHGEIKYQCSTLPEAFERCGRQIDSECGDWLQRIGQRLNAMEGTGFLEIWEQQLKELKERTELNAVHIEELRRLGSQLSYPDKDTQLGALELYQQRLRQQEETLTKELPGKRKLGTALGLLGSIFLALVLI